MKIRRISAAALAAVMMTGTAVTAFAEDEINADFKAKVDDLAAKVAELQKKAEELTAKYGDDASKLSEDQQAAAAAEAMEILAGVLGLTPSIQEIIDVKDTLNEAEKKYAEEKLPGIFDTTGAPDLGIDLPTTNPDPDTTGSDTTTPGTTDPSDTTPTTPGNSDTTTIPSGSDNSDTGVGGIAVLAGTVALAGAVAIIARKKK